MPLINQAAGRLLPIVDEMLAIAAAIVLSTMVVRLQIRGVPHTCVPSLSTKNNARCDLGSNEL